MSTDPLALVFLCISCTGFGFAVASQLWSRRFRGLLRDLNELHDYERRQMVRALFPERGP